MKTRILSFAMEGVDLASVDEMKIRLALLVSLPSAGFPGGGIPTGGAGEAAPQDALATIDDPGILDENAEALSRLGYPRDTALGSR